MPLHTQPHFRCFHLIHIKRNITILLSFRSIVSLDFRFLFSPGKHSIVDADVLSLLFAYYIFRLPLLQKKARQIISSATSFIYAAMRFWFYLLAWATLHAAISFCNNTSLSHRLLLLLILLSLPQLLFTFAYAIISTFITDFWRLFSFRFSRFHIHCFTAFPAASHLCIMLQCLFSR